MTKKAEQTRRLAPVQKYTLREITDPAEQAALDERIKRAEKASAEKALREALSQAATADLMLELCRRLSVEERTRVATALTTLPVAEQHGENVERLAAS